MTVLQRIPGSDYPEHSLQHAWNQAVETQEVYM